MVGRQMAAGIDEIIVIVLEEVCVLGNPLRNRASARSCVAAPRCLLSDGITPSERKGRGKRRNRVEGGWNVCAERSGRGAIRF